MKEMKTKKPRVQDSITFHYWVSCVSHFLSMVLPLLVFLLHFYLKVEQEEEDQEDPESHRQLDFSLSFLIVWAALKGLSLLILLSHRPNPDHRFLSFFLL